MAAHALYAYPDSCAHLLTAAVASALDGGPAVLALPPGPREAAERVLRAARPHAVVGPDGVPAPLPDPAPCDEGTALAVATSGSEGTPKIVELAASAVVASAEATRERLSADPGERWLCPLPTHHIAGLMVLARSLLGGAEPVVQRRFEPERFAAAAERAPRTSVVPTMLARCLDAGIDLSGFRSVLVGGAASAPGLLDRARAAGVRVVETYGMTETCGGCVYDGVPLRGVEVALDEDGRIRLEGPTLGTRYRFGEPIARGGGFRTGDLGRLGPGGALTVLGRADDVIVSGGEKIHPQRLESVLAEHPAVAAAAVVGRPDPRWGTAVVAVVVPAAGAEPPALDELRGHVAARAERWLVPREMRLVAELPLLASGKVDRAALARYVTEHQARRTRPGA